MIYFLIYLILFFIGYIVFYNIKVRDKILGWKNSGQKRMSKKGIIFLCCGVFLVSTVSINIFVNSIIAAIALGLLPVIGVYSLIDITERYWEDREMKQITFFLMTMAKWSSVKNDLVYCLKKTSESNIRKPLGTMVTITLGRIYGGMTPGAAFSLLEEEARSEDFQYMIKNIRFAAEKGGNLQKLFKSMEEQYFKIDEEFFKRKISTLRDRIAVYVTIFMVIGTGIWFIGNNSVAGTFYLRTLNGNMLLMAFVLVFGAGIMVMMKR
ncbi:MAG: type II secretion system F family protein [Clostridiales bacterium]|nr:type II secretion system F family protein [Clostridiales bacterium]